MYKRDAILQFLEDRNANTTEHSGRAFIDHLLGTEALLKEWEMWPEVRLAGLYHSIYGTNIFSVQSAGFGEREKVQALIGMKAEWLAYLFCVADRPRAFFNAYDTYSIIHRFTGDIIPITKEERRDLLVIEAANQIEQEMGQHVIQVIHDDPLHSFMLGEKALAGMKAYLLKHGRTPRAAR
jgi:hypothetical protein